MRSAIFRLRGLSKLVQFAATSHSAVFNLGVSSLSSTSLSDLPRKSKAFESETKGSSEFPLPLSLSHLDSHAYNLSNEYFSYSQYTVINRATRSLRDKDFNLLFYLRKRWSHLDVLLLGRSSKACKSSTSFHEFRRRKLILPLSSFSPLLLSLFDPLAQ